MGFALLIVAITLFCIVTIPGLCVTIIKCKDWNGYAKQVADSIDIFGNVFFQYFLNATMLTKESTYHFGREGEFMSTAYRVNYLAGTCSRLGKFICKILIKANDPQFK